MFRLTRPGSDELDRLLAHQRAAEFAYSGVGGTLRGEFPAGFRADHFQVELGRGDDVWTNATAALKDWQPQRGSGLTVVADGPVERGTNVVIVAPLPIGCAVAACRIVGLLDVPDTWGFAYGTLPAHPEEGEELFVVRRVDGIVTFEIVAFSKPRHPVARLGGPLARSLQRRATRRYLAAMEVAAGSGGGRRRKCP